MLKFRHKLAKEHFKLQFITTTKLRKNIYLHIFLNKMIALVRPGETTAHQKRWDGDTSHDRAQKVTNFLNI